MVFCPYMVSLPYFYSLIHLSFVHSLKNIYSSTNIPCMSSIQGLGLNLLCLVLICCSFIDHCSTYYGIYLNSDWNQYSTFVRLKCNKGFKCPNLSIYFWADKMSFVHTVRRLLDLKNERILGKEHQPGKTKRQYMNMPAIGQN